MDLFVQSSFCSVDYVGVIDSYRCAEGGNFIFNALEVGLKTGLGLDPSLTGACGLTLWVGDSPTQFFSDPVRSIQPPCQWRIQTWGEGRGGRNVLDW